MLDREQMSAKSACICEYGTRYCKNMKTTTTNKNILTSPLKALVLSA